MAEAFYPPTPATDGATMNPVPGASFQVFETTDTTFSTPLSLRVGSGNPTTTVNASDGLAILPGVYVTSPNFEHIWKSGSFEWRRDSIDGAKAAVEAAKADTAASASNAATSAQAAKDAAALVDAPADTAVKALIEDPATQTRIALDATTTEAIGEKIAASPRDTLRVKHHRKRIATIDRAFPNEITDHRIVWADGNTLHAIGRDRSLRSTLDAGYTWSFKTSNSGDLGQWALHGLFYKTSAGSFITTYHPDDQSAPSIVRSSNNGVTFTTVIPAKTNVSYLGTSSICQDPNTGHLYLVEYVTVDAATTATWSIMRSTDDGATWSAFHTFNRAGTGATRHGHGAQYDPVSQRVYFITGDGEPAAGIYRVNAAGTGVEAVVLNGTITGHPSSTTSAATAVAVMFFPDYIAWGMDATSDAYLLRLPRTQIGQANPQVEQIMRLQSTAWWATRASGDNTTWLMLVSNEVAAAGSVDNLVHVYTVGDNGATVDEVLAVAGDSGITSCFAPVGTPLQSGPTIWLAATRWKGGHPNNNGLSAFQIGLRLGWGDAAIMARPDIENGRLFYNPETISDGRVALAASGLQVIGSTDVPAQARRLYILNMGVYPVSGTGSARIRLFNLSTNDTVKIKGTSSPVEYGGRDYRTINGEETAPYIMTTDILTKGQRILIQVQNTSTTDTVDAAARLTFAWGF